MSETISKADFLRMSVAMLDCIQALSSAAFEGDLAKRLDAFKRFSDKQDAALEILRRGCLRTKHESDMRGGPTRWSDRAGPHHHAHWSAIMASIHITPEHLTCEVCAASFEQGAKGSNRFCGPSCAAAHARTGRRRKSTSERYEGLVIRRGQDDCWGWSGFKYKGYGRMRVGSASVGAHRVSYELHVEPIPDGMTVLHKCDNPECTNPRHLFVGTNEDNNRDRDEKGRQAIGVRAPTAKLTESAVRDIRRNVTTKRGSNLASFARKYGVTRKTAGDAYHGRTWGHVK